MKNKIIYIVIITLLFVSCIKTNNHSNTENSNDSITLNLEVNDSNLTKTDDKTWIGEYKGILPCEDCDGIETQIALNEDTTYFLKMEYFGKGEPFTDKGKFFWNKDNTIITITLEDNSTQQYLVLNGTLTVLDSQGKIPEGELKNDYVLKKMY